MPSVYDLGPHNIAIEREYIRLENKRKKICFSYFNGNFTISLLNIIICIFILNFHQPMRDKIHTVNIYVMKYIIVLVMRNFVMKMSLPPFLTNLSIFMISRLDVSLARLIRY